jgi:hypothetical protein
LCGLVGELADWLSDGHGDEFLDAYQRRGIDVWLRGS